MARCFSDPYYGKLISLVVSLRKKFGKRLRYFRVIREMSQEQLAERAGISVDFVSLVERGINAPSFETLEAISTALQVEVSEMFIFDK